MLIKLQHSFTDINGVVADPFEISGDLKSGCYQTKITCRWLIEGEQTNAPVIGFNIQPIDLKIMRNGLARFGGISVDQRFNRPRDLHLNQRAHFEQRLA